MTKRTIRLKGCGVAAPVEQEIYRWFQRSERRHEVGQGLNNFPHSIPNVAGFRYLVVYVFSPQTRRS